MARDDKLAKEANVSGLTGGSIAEINAVSLVMPLSILLWSVLQSRLRLFTPYTPYAAFVDFLLNCGAVLGATTVYSSIPWLLNLLLALPAALVFLLNAPVRTKHNTSRPSSKSEASKSVPLDPLPVKPFITNHRGSMVVITCVAILAVDFQIFPRRFAKVENWGTSLMDIGVGSFVFTSGVVSVRSFLKFAAGQRPSLSKQLLGSFRHSIPLLVLGVIRLISVKGLDYAEHVTEYGVHWNFFFTLAFLPPFVALFQPAFDIVPSYAVLSCILGAAYEVALDFTDLTKYIISAPRKDLISQNREGICSFFGYLAIFLAGQSVGSIVLPREQVPRKDTTVRELLKHSILARLTIAALLWCLLFWFSTSYYGLGLPVSRRLANLPYFLWVSAFNTAHIAICCAIESVCFPNIHRSSVKEVEAKRSKEATSTILLAVNRNGLAVFLVANLLTGLVNLTVPTLKMGVWQSMAILSGYTFTVSGVAILLHRLNWIIKL
ncbi:GPI-anchored wall transfer protein 1 [Polyplosphaeria fusca]|uniref:GPI-anchored wall transfer protein n=1 Tax=Polyplosphaeria fusca TaxID=682080 RepID=A0A9P4R4E3_9PLEO|nr:GPI-anchored wall transfer protein 1 [Polyplosphaeria fusca]